MAWSASTRMVLATVVTMLNFSYLYSESCLTYALSSFPLPLLFSHCSLSLLVLYKSSSPPLSPPVLLHHSVSSSSPSAHPQCFLSVCTLLSPGPLLITVFQPQPDLLSDMFTHKDKDIMDLTMNETTLTQWVAEFETVHDQSLLSRCDIQPAPPGVFDDLKSVDDGSDMIDVGTGEWLGKRLVEVEKELRRAKGKIEALQKELEFMETKLTSVKEKQSEHPKKFSAVLSKTGGLADKWPLPKTEAQTDETPKPGIKIILPDSVSWVQQVHKLLRTSKIQGFISRICSRRLCQLLTSAAWIWAPVRCRCKHHPVNPVSTRLCNRACPQD
jgi:hypothetical protein